MNPPKAEVLPSQSSPTSSPYASTDTLWPAASACPCARARRSGLLASPPVESAAALVAPLVESAARVRREARAPTRPRRGDVEAGRAPARVRPRDHLPLPQHGNLVGGRNAHHDVKLHDVAEARPVEVDGAHSAHGLRSGRPPRVGLEVPFRSFQHASADATTPSSLSSSTPSPSSSSSSSAGHRCVGRAGAPQRAPSSHALFLNACLASFHIYGEWNGLREMLKEWVRRRKVSKLPVDPNDPPKLRATR